MVQVGSEWLHERQKGVVGEVAYYFKKKLDDSSL